MGYFAVDAMIVHLPKFLRGSSINSGSGVRCARRSRSLLALA